MKKQLLVLTTLILSITSFSFAQNLENGDFEDIQSITRMNPNNDPFTYDSIGSYWVTGDEIKRDIALTPDPGPFCKDTSWAHSGNHALLMRTMDLAGVIGTGNAGIGVYEFDNTNPFNSVKIGTPFPHRPDKLTGYYAFQSVAGDSCWIALFFSKWNTSTNKRDTLAFSEFVSNQSTGFSAYTQFELPINFINSDIPDTMGILMCSSKGGYEVFPPVGQPGTTLIVDSLTFYYNNAGINELQDDFILFQTNEDNINLSVKDALKESASVKVFDASGKLIESRELTQGDNKFYMNARPATYLFQIESVKGSFSRKMLF